MLRIIASIAAVLFIGPPILGNLHAQVTQCVDSTACNYTPTGADPVDFPTVCIELEWIADHEAAPLDGFTTYRLYVHLPDSTDFLSAISGSSSDTISVTTTTSFFQHNIGGATATDANSALFGFFPDLAYDSWVTVGYAPEEGTASTPVSTISSPDQNWPLQFESGNGITIDDQYGGLWYILNDGNSQGLAGPNRRVLIAQLTTDGEISAQIAGQYFPDFGSGPGGSANGDIDNRFNSSLGGSCPFDPNADCTYANEGEDCAGECDGEIDECGVCAGIGAAFQCGCANIPPGDCDCNGNQTDAVGACGGNCPADLDGDGICDLIGPVGCTYESASNFAPTAIHDDGSCTFEPAAGNCQFDSNGDGVVSVQDLLNFLVALGNTCE